MPQANIEYSINRPRQVTDPAAYGMVAVGDCLSPVIKNGDTIICSPSAKVSEGMIVAFYFKNGATPKVKRLANLPAPLHPDSNVAFPIQVTMDNPPATFILDPGNIEKMHRVVGVVRKGKYFTVSASRGRRARR